MIRNHRDSHRGRLPDVVGIPGAEHEEFSPTVQIRLGAANGELERSVGNRREQSLHAAVNDPTISISATWRERCLKERAALLVFLLCFLSCFVDVPTDGLFFWVAVGCLVIALLRVLFRLLVRIGGLFVFPSTNGSN